jgi:hypothetical protein
MIFNKLFILIAQFYFIPILDVDIAELSPVVLPVIFPLLIDYSSILFILSSINNLFSFSYIFLMTEDLMGMILGFDKMGANFFYC